MTLLRHGDRTHGQEELSGTCDFKRFTLTAVLETDYREGRQKQANRLGTYYKCPGDVFGRAKVEAAGFGKGLGNGWIVVRGESDGHI